jgi:hypothetical protein
MISWSISDMLTFPVASKADGSASEPLFFHRLTGFWDTKTVDCDPWINVDSSASSSVRTSADELTRI